MANTYAQIYIQVVFSVQGRQSLIQREHKEELYKYVSGIVRNKKQKLIAINGMADHVHIFLGMKPDIAFPIWSEISRTTPRNSSTRRNGSEVDSIGRKASVLFRMGILRSMLS